MCCDDVSFALGEGRAARPAGPQRRRQVDLHECRRWASCRRGAARSRCSASRSRGLPPEQIAARGVALVPQGRRIFRSLTVRENLVVAARKPDAGSRHAPWTIDTVFGMFPRLAERTQPDRRASVRRRAADAGDRPRADGESARAADGRAVGRAGAADRRRGRWRRSAS